MPQLSGDKNSTDNVELVRADNMVMELEASNVRVCPYEGCRVGAWHSPWGTEASSGSS